MVAATVSPSPLAAQEVPSVHAEAGVGPVVLDGDFGLQAAAGLSLRAERWAVALRAVEFALMPGEVEAGYRWQRLQNGQRRCREEATGRFARDTRCIALETALGASAEARWRAAGGPTPLWLGAGYRVGDASGPYGMVRWRVVADPGEASWHLEAAAGLSLFRLSVGAALGL